MRSVRAQCFSRQEMSWKERPATRISWKWSQCTHVVEVHAVVSEKWPSLWFPLRYKLQCAMNNSWVSVVRLRSQETRHPTSDVEVATPFARDFNPSIALRLPTATAFEGSNFSSFDSFLILKILASLNFSLTFEFLASFNLFLTVSFLSIVSSANLTSLGFLAPLDSCPPFLRVVLFLRWSPKCFRQHVCRIWFCCHLDNSPSASLLHVLEATASSSVCDGCSGQFLHAKQLLSHSKILHAVRFVASDSSRQTSSANLILSILPS